MLKKFEIIADIPEGYEPTGEYRPPVVDEWFLNFVCEAERCFSDFTTPRLILRRLWEPPACLKPGWIWSNNGVDWYWSTRQPYISVGCYIMEWGECTSLISHTLNCTWPDWTDWKASLRSV